MLDLIAWITYLSAQCPTLDNRVFGSVELEEYQENSKTLPAAFVMLSRENATRNAAGKDSAAQIVTATVTVVVLVGNTSGDTVGGQSGLKDVRSEIRAALLNWKPNGKGGGNVVIGTESGLVGGDAAIRGALRWDDTFQIEYAAAARR